MAFNVRHPLWISTVAIEKPGAYAFASLFFLESMARALLATVISLHAFEILQDEQKISVLFTSVALCTLAASSFIPHLIRLTARRYVYSLGVVLILLAAVGLTMGGLLGQILGMLFRTLGASCLNIALSLYIMDYIRKQDLVKSEPIRLLYSTFAWVCAPFVGVFLWREYGMWAMSLACGIICASLLVLFWVLRLSDTIKAAHSPPSNPLQNLWRFWSQPRLRLAWLIAFTRSAWWVTFFVYTPIYMVTSGQSEYIAATVIMLGSASLLVNVITNRLAKKFSIRRVLTFAFGLCGGLSVVIGFVHGHAYTAATLFIIAATFLSFTDGLGSIPFMRSVHPYERESMTTVYRTFMDAAELLPQIAYGLLLFVLPFSYVYTFLGGWLILASIVIYRFLPTKL